MATHSSILASLIALLVNNPPAVQETPVQFLCWEDPLEEGIGYPLQYSWVSLVAQLGKNPPAMWKTWVQSLAWVGKIPWRGERLRTPVFWPREFHGLCMGHKESDTTEQLSLSLRLGRKAMTNLDGILKSRDVTLPTKVRMVKATVFPVVMYE